MVLSAETSPTAATTVRDLFLAGSIGFFVGRMDDTGGRRDIIMAMRWLNEDAVSIGGLKMLYDYGVDWVASSWISTLQISLG